MNYSVCIEALFQGRDVVESMKIVKTVGFRAFEFWTWWDKDVAAINTAKDDLDLEVAAFCTRFVSLVDASQREEYLYGLRESIQVAQRLGCKTLISQVGNELPDVPRPHQHATLINGLKACVPLLAESGVTLVFEPLNTLVDHQGYYLWSSAEAFAIADEVGSPYVKVLYDIYHQQIMEGHLISRIRANIQRIGHFHAAGNPGRHELTSGEIRYPEVFKAITESGYQGFVGLEYFPVHDPVHGLRELVRTAHKQ